VSEHFIEGKILYFLAKNLTIFPFVIQPIASYSLFELHFYLKSIYL
jgi:hypothetical protein